MPRMFLPRLSSSSLLKMLCGVCASSLRLISGILALPLGENPGRKSGRKSGEKIGFATASNKFDVVSGDARMNSGILVILHMFSSN